MSIKFGEEFYIESINKYRTWLSATVSFFFHKFLSGSLRMLCGLWSWLRVRYFGSETEGPALELRLEEFPFELEMTYIIYTFY